MVLCSSLGGHTPSSIAVAADELRIQALRQDLPLQCPPKDDAETWGHPRVPLRLPIIVLTNLAREQLERPSEGAGSGLPIDSSRPLQHPYGPPPAVVEESLATAELNSSYGLAGGRQRGQDSFHLSQEFSGNSPALMIGGTRVSNEREDNNARLYVALPQSQGFLPPRSPQVRGRPCMLCTVRSGIMMELPPGNRRTAGKGRLAHVYFPLRGPQHPVEYWPWPIPLSSSTPGVPAGVAAHCFICPRPPSFNPFLVMPVSFAPAPKFGPLLPSYFASFPSWGMPPPASSSRKHK
nr:proline-rich protein 32 [Manis javanica]